MQKLGTRTVVFLKTFKSCVEEGWKASDTQYHIPKSRFNEDKSDTNGYEASPDNIDMSPKNNYLRRFRNCFSEAWKAADTHYHIPKSRHGKAV